jgi:alkylhydroperoxidase family enzyme
MAWIRYIEESEAEPVLDRLYRQILEPESGGVDHILKIHGPDPAALRAHLQLYRSVMQETDSLPRAEREMIAYTVSRVNECHY